MFSSLPIANCSITIASCHYIVLQAVVCLDGDGCKIRNGLSIDEEDLTLDTSIACDSCDIW